MKKMYIVQGLVLLLLFNVTLSASFALTENDYQIINEKNSVITEYKEVMGFNNFSFVEADEKFGIIDKKTNKFILEPVADEIISYNKTNKTEFKIKINNQTGYINDENSVIFITEYDDMFLTDKYIKTKKDGKYGLIDKNGNIILYPEFQNVGILYSNGNEYISAKQNGKYKLFYNTGKLIPENELYTVQTNKNYILAANIRPEFRLSGSNKQTIYEKINAHENDNDGFVYEIQEMKIPGKIKKDVINESDNKSNNIKNNNSLITIGKKNYYVTTSGTKIGLETETGKTIVPAIYDSYKLTTPCEHFSTPVILAERNDTYAVYNTKGKLLAEQVYDKVNVYRFGKVYSYQLLNGAGIIKDNNKEIGILSKENNDYKFTKTGFSLFTPHKINELIITILNAQNK